MDRENQWLKTLTQLIADILDAKVEISQEFSEPKHPQDLSIANIVFSPKHLVTRPAFMNRDIGKDVYGVIRAEAEHEKINLRHVTMDYSPKNQEVQLSLACGCQQSLPSSEEPPPSPLVHPSAPEEGDDTLP